MTTSNATPDPFVNDQGGWTTDEYAHLHTVSRAQARWDAAFAEMEKAEAEAESLDQACEDLMAARLDEGDRWASATDDYTTAVEWAHSMEEYLLDFYADCVREGFEINHGGYIAPEHDAALKSEHGH